MSGEASWSGQEKRKKKKMEKPKLPAKGDTRPTVVSKGGIVLLGKKTNGVAEREGVLGVFSPGIKQQKRMGSLITHRRLSQYSSLGRSFIIPKKNKKEMKRDKKESLSWDQDGKTEPIPGRGGTAIQEKPHPKGESENSKTDRLGQRANTRNGGGGFRWWGKKNAWGTYGILYAGQAQKKETKKKTKKKKRAAMDLLSVKKGGALSPEGYSAVKKVAVQPTNKIQLLAAIPDACPAVTEVRNYH